MEDSDSTRRSVTEMLGKKERTRARGASVNCARELAVRCTDVTSVGGPRWQRRHAQIRPRGKVPSGRALRLETDYPAQQVRLQVVRRQVERQRCVAARAVPESISVRAAIGAILPR